VGSAWQQGGGESQYKPAQIDTQALGADSRKILELAKAQRMNTDVRRAVFCVIMGSDVCSF
jgi:hypothetical protein